MRIYQRLSPAQGNRITTQLASFFYRFFPVLKSEFSSLLFRLVLRIAEPALCVAPRAELENDVPGFFVCGKSCLFFKQIPEYAQVNILVVNKKPEYLC
jgi:hypothetical protein